MKFSTILTFAIVLLPLFIFAQPVNDICSGAIALPAFPRTQSCPDDDGVSSTVVINGTNVDATPSVPFPNFDCGGTTTGPSPDVYYTFRASGAINEITVTTTDMNAVQVVGFVGSDCDNVQAQTCGVGSTVTITVFVQPGEQIFLLVAGAPNSPMDVGTFVIEVNSSSNCAACARSDNGEVIINPRNATGQYPCNETVEICFTLFEFIGNEANSVEFLHSIVPTFGPGWDVSTISPSIIPGSCSRTGNWRYYPDGWTSCQTGLTFPRGFAYETLAGYDDTCGSSNSSPGNNWGDGDTLDGPCTNRRTPTEWCWTIDTQDCPPGGTAFTGQDLSVDVQVLSDGASGSWENDLCNANATYSVIATVIVCDDLDPLVMEMPETCADTDDGSVTVDPNGGNDPVNSYNFEVRNASSTLVAGASNVTGQQVFTGLASGDYTVTTTGIISGCPRSSPFTILEGTSPDAIATADDLVCPGNGPIQLMGETTFAGTISEYSWTGPGGFTSTEQNPLTADPAAEGDYFLSVTVDGCAGQAESVSVAYLDFDPQLSAASTSVCFGDDVELEVTNGGTSFEWFDDNGNLVPETSSSLTIPVMSEGQVTYSVNVTDANSCTTSLDIEINVANQIFADINITDNGNICKAEDPNDPDAIFVIRMPGMTTFPPGWTFDWDNGVATGDTYELFDVAPGNYTVTVDAMNPEGCSQTFTADYTVNESPTVVITPADASVCAGGDVTLTVTASEGTGPYAYSWIVEGVEVENDPTFNLSGVNFTVQDIFVEVSDQNTCKGISPFVTVTVFDPPGAVTFQPCTDPAPNEGAIEFNWDDVGQTHFELYSRIGTGTEMEIDLDYTATSYNTGPLPGGSTVTIRVIPVRGTGTTRCAGPGRTFSCSNQVCANPGWRHTTITDVCVSADNQPYEFLLGTAVAGTVTLNSNTLGLTDLTADADGSTTILLPEIPDGTSGLTHQITASFVDAAGACPFDTTFSLPVVRAGDPGLTVAEDDICATSSDVEFTLTNAFDVNSDYVISITDPSGTTIVSADPAAGSWTIRFTEFRTHQVTLTTTQNANAGCSDSFTLPFTLRRPPAAPTLVCGDSGNDFVIFSWSDIGAESYTVNEVSIPPGATGTQTAFEYRVDGLAVGATATISVTAVFSECPNVTSTELSCVAQSCPAFPVTITTPTDSLCAEDAVGLIDLTATTPGAGSLVWSGPGVMGAQFDPVAAGDGNHTITAVYTEGPCSTPASIVIPVSAPPSTSFTADPVCLGDPTLLTYNGDPSGLTFSWSMPGGTPATATGPGPISVTYATGGDKSVILAVTSGACNSARTQVFMVEEPLERPVITCQNSNFEQVGFGWTHPIATNFFMTKIDEPASAQTMLGNNSALFTGLMIGDSVTISIEALHDGPCGNSVPDTLTCYTQVCPDVTVSIPELGPYCVSDNSDVDLIANITGDPDNSGILSWMDGSGNTDETFNPSVLGEGSYTFTATYLEEGCTFSASVDVEVNSGTTSEFDLFDGPICTGTEILGAVAGGEMAGWNYDWSAPSATVNPGFDEASKGFSWSAPGRYYVSLTVTNAANCTGETFTDSIDVFAPLLTPEITCTDVTMESVTFSWAAQPNVDNYRISVDGGAPFVQDSTRLTVLGLSNNQDVVIEVTPLPVTASPCPDPTPGTATCMASSCPDIRLSIAGLGPFCADEDMTVDLVADVTGATNGTGTLTWMGSDGSTSASFNPALLGSGTYTFTATLAEQNCTYSAAVMVVVNEIPSSEFSLPDGPICAGTEILGAVAGGEMAGWSYEFVAPSANVTPGNDDASRNFNWSTTGRYFVSLTVTNAANCTGETFTDSIDVFAPLEIPVITCGEVTTESVIFNWPDQEGADNYRVSVDGAAAFTQDSTTLTVSGLSVDQDVVIEVTPLSVSPCSDAMPGTATCSTTACPDLQVTPPPRLDICLGFDDPLTLLSALVTGDMGTGDISFSGPGVESIGVNFFFSGFIAGIGTHQLAVEFTEGTCTTRQTFLYTVLERPSAEFNLNGLTTGIELCVGEEFALNYTGSTTAADNADFCYVYLEQDPEITGTIGFESYTARYDQPGPFRIGLVVKEDGCPSDTMYVEGVVLAPFTAPVVVCENPTINSVTFSWEDVGTPDGYTIIRENGATETTLTNSVTYDGLQPEQVITIEVEANDSGICGIGGRSTAVSCAALPCPDLTADLASLPDQICILNGTETIDLAGVVITGGNGGGSYTFSGEGVSGSTFNAGTVPNNETGTTYTITIADEETPGCPFSVTHDVTVFARPTAFITDPGSQCVGEPVIITVGSTNFVASDDITLDFDGGTSVPDGNPDDATYSIVYTIPGPKRITATVISTISGCPSEEAVLMVEIMEPMPLTSVTCINPGVDLVTFDWDVVAGVTDIVLTDQSGNPFVLDAGATELTVDGLDPGSSLTITFSETGNGPCGNQMEQTVTCFTRVCPAGEIEASAPVQRICLNGTEDRIPLVAELSDGDINGTVTWTGNGIVLVDADYLFDPTGLPAGDYLLTAIYDGPSSCDSESEITIFLQEAPMVSFNTIPAQLCQGEEFNVFFTGTAPEGATFSWNFDGAVVTDLDDESYLLRWDTPGRKTVTLDIGGECTASGSFMVPVVPTLAAPVPTCARQDLDGVLFEWPAVAEATAGYRISINGAPFEDPQPETSLMINNLDFGESVSISVLSVRNGTTCNESVPSPAVDCAARLCPQTNLAPAAAKTTFCDSETESVLLEANQTGGAGTGELEWSGPGVVLADGDWTFRPELAGVGRFPIIVTYTEEDICVYTDTLVMTVTATPVVTLNSSADVTCTTTAVTVGVQAPDPAVTYVWDFAGAEVTDLGGERYELTWATAAAHTVMVTGTANGCLNSAAANITVEGESDAGEALAEALQICVGVTDPIDLSSRITGGMPGGSWSVVAGSVADGNLDAVTGLLNPAGLAAGNYTFAYTVTGDACPDGNAEVTLLLLGAPVANAGDDQLLTCNTGMVSLNGFNSETGEGYTYLWTSDVPGNLMVDADQLMIDVSQPGTYTLRVTNAIGCSATSAVEVTAETEAPVMQIQLSQVTCFSSDNGAVSVTDVSGGRPPYTFTLNGEDRGQSTLFAGLEAAEYNLQVTDANGCFSNILLGITEPDELTISLRFPGDSATADAGDVVFISANINGGNPVDTLLWEPDSLVMTDGQNGISFVADESRMISVTVVDELGCSATDRMMLLVRRDRPVYFPTAFSPNGDNINDVFFIGGDVDEIDFIDNFSIFDRWGEEVFRGGQVTNGTTISAPTADGSRFAPNDPDFGWDGNINGRPINPQVFVYTASVHFSDGEVIVYKGDFLLMR